MVKGIRRRDVPSALAFSVQDRRNRARALLETRQRKAALLTLDASDVAHRLQIMRPPEEIMDNRSDTENRIKSSPKPLDTSESFDETSPLRRIPISYEQWMEEGFPADYWRPLLVEELYHPLEAEQMHLKAKYTLIRKNDKKDNKENSPSKGGKK